MKSYEIHLPYYKQGDDLSWCLEETKGNVCEALNEHAKMLISASEVLIKIKMITEEMNMGDKVHIEANTHFIGIEAPEELIKVLLSKELISVMEWDDDDEDCYEEEDE